jgi:two-component system phosphate regulon sensor histidine kinase PhoR
MNKPIKKIIIILLAFSILPVIFWAVRDAVSLRDDEQMLQSIYKNQLETILFSVNQYSDDIIRSWVLKIESSISNSEESIIKEFMEEHASVNSIVITDTSGLSTVEWTSKSGVIIYNKVTDRALIDKNSQTIDLLLRNFNSGFQRIAPIESDSAELQNLMILLQNRQICIIGLRKEQFVDEILAAKIRLIAQSNISASVFDSNTNRVVFSTNGNNTAPPEESNFLWIIPSYKIGLQLTGTSLKEIIDDRNKVNIILLITLLVLMIGTAAYLYVNFKKEIELAQIKADFVANVSHELRTPLSLIQMFADTLALGRVKTEEKKYEYYEILSRETDRLSKIVNKILNFSKIEAGKWKFNFVTISINETVRNIYDTYKFHLQNNACTFSVKFGDDLPQILGDSEAISEAIINLIDNAVKFSGENKHIEIETGRENENIFVSVIDHGIGISATDQKKIFDKFFRVSTGNVHNVKGTGLGLSLVKHIVEAHKGKIELKSEIGKGTTIKVLFPLKINEVIK